MNRKVLTIAAAVACAGTLAAAGVVFASSGRSAAPAAKTTHATGKECRPGHPTMLRFALALFAGREADLQIYRGTLQDENGDQLRLQVPSALCASGDIETVTIPAGANVRRDGSSATLGDLRPGDVVGVILSSHGDYILAGDARYMAGR